MWKEAIELVDHLYVGGLGDTIKSPLFPKAYVVRKWAQKCISSYLTPSLMCKPVLHAERKIENQTEREANNQADKKKQTGKEYKMPTERLESKTSLNLSSNTC